MTPFLAFLIFVGGIGLLLVVLCALIAKVFR